MVHGNWSDNQCNWSDTWLSMLLLSRTPCSLSCLEHMPAHAHTHIHTCTHTHMHACIHTCTYACMHTHIHTHPRTHMHTYTHTHTHTHSHTHTHTHTHTSNTHNTPHALSLSLSLSLSVSLSVCLSLSLCALLLLFCFWELVRQNNSLYLWPVADFPPQYIIYAVYNQLMWTPCTQTFHRVQTASMDRCTEINFIQNWLCYWQRTLS